MKKLTKEQKFLYTRVVILIASVGWIASAFAGFMGFSYWYGGFVLFFWLAFGLLNYPHRTSLWLAANRRIPFLLFYAAVAGLFFIGDRFGLRELLWIYPLYHSWGFLWVSLILYPFAMFSLLELLFFVTTLAGDRLTFIPRKGTWLHHTLDATESVLFLISVGVIVLGALGKGVPLAAVFYILIAWLSVFTIKLRFHLPHTGHYAWILGVTVCVAILLNELPNTVAREWIYLSAPILNLPVFGIPLWACLSWYWMTMCMLRLWILLVLHPKSV